MCGKRFPFIQLVGNREEKHEIEPKNDSVSLSRKKNFCSLFDCLVSLFFGGEESCVPFFFLFLSLSLLQKLDFQEIETDWPETKLNSLKNF